MQRSLCLALLVLLAAPNGGDAILQRAPTKHKVWPMIRTRMTGARISAFELINTISNNKIMNLVNGTVVTTSSIRGMSSPSFSINAVVNGTDVRSVQFVLNRMDAMNEGSVRKIENHKPFSLCGSRGRNIQRCASLGYGSYTLSVTPYPRKRGRGAPGRSTTISFTIGSGASPTVAASTKAPVLLPRGTTNRPVSTPVTPTVAVSPVVPTVAISPVVPVAISPSVMSPSLISPTVPFTMAPVDDDSAPSSLPWGTPSSSMTRSPDNTEAPTSPVTMEPTLATPQPTGAFPVFRPSPANSPSLIGPSGSTTPVDAPVIRMPPSTPVTMPSLSVPAATVPVVSRAPATPQSPQRPFAPFVKPSTPSNPMVPTVGLSTKSPTAPVTPRAPTKAPTFGASPFVVAPMKAPVPAATPAAQATQPPSPFAGVSHLELIDVSSKPNKAVMRLNLREINIVNLQTLRLAKDTKFNVNAIRNGTAVNSVGFSNGQRETTLPWAYCGNLGPEFYTCPDLVVSKTINITIVPYPETFQQGIPFPLLWSTVHIIERAAADAPVRTSVPAPKAPVPKPVVASVPVLQPVVVAPVPVQTSPIAPVATGGAQKCSTPKLVGNWKDSPVPHFPVAEAQGAMIGTTMVLVGGFREGYESVSTETHTFDTTNASAVWERQDDYPFATGVTHSAAVVVRNQFFMCGGYAGGGIGVHTDVCMVYDVTQPRGKQWSTMTKLPDGGRGGGGMIYDSGMNALIFSAGATRATSSFRSAIDHNTTWMYRFSNPSAGWVAKAPMPFFANHMSSVTAIDASGIERHFFSGGQKQEDEHDGNQAEHFEYDAINDKWYSRKFMPIPRGHAASSTRAIGCGFIMVAGCTNKGERLSDISYYDIPTDSWTKIGDLSVPMNTPVCDMSKGILYCDTGWDSGIYSAQIGIAIAI